MAKTHVYRMSLGLGLIVVLWGAAHVARGQIPRVARRKPPSEV